MKKYPYLLSLALSLVLVAPAFIYAQDNQSAPVPQPKLNTITGHLQSEYQAGMVNLQNNRDYRNTLIIQGQSGNPGMMPPGSISPLMKRFASSTMFASSTLIQQMMMNHQREQGLRADAFAFLQDNLVRQSNQSLDNLKQIRARIAELIQTETAKGIDMTKATALLTTADNDISTAEQSIKALVAYVPSTGSAALTASTTIDLGQARQLGSAAIQSIDAARQALDQVVSAIIQAMGVSPTASSTETTQSSNQ